jgi:hypothetical protein
MPDDTKKWKPPLWGKAKTAFNEAVQAKAKPPVKAVEAQGRDSQMIKNTKPAPVLKPSGFAGHVMAQQTHNKALAQESKAVQSPKPKTAISLEDQKEIDKLNAKFRQAAIRERQQDKGI